ncbi:MAG TPA: site-2 protease family protein, partial [Candidatus Bathyarchaeia archaeon]
TFETVSMYLIPPTLASGLVPFSDALTPFYTHSFLGAQWTVIANLLFWLWFININIAVFNALPIYPLDGGRMFNIALKGVFKEKNREKLVSVITIGVTVTIIVVLAMTVAIPFITPFFV